jgi:hypothetical protein
MIGDDRERNETDSYRVISKTGGWEFEPLHSCQQNQILSNQSCRTLRELGPNLDPSASYGLMNPAANALSTPATLVSAVCFRLRFA